jgi:hypothetical protein
MGGGACALPRVRVAVARLHTCVLVLTPSRARSFSSAAHVLQRAVEGGVESFLDEDERFQNFVRDARACAVHPLRRRLAERVSPVFRS